MKPQDLINGFKYFYPDTGIKVLASVNKIYKTQLLVPVNGYHDIGNGRGIPVSATKENCAHLKPWQSKETV